MKKNKIENCVTIIEMVFYLIPDIEFLKFFHAWKSIMQKYFASVSTSF